jgi:hypothetical protein
LMTCLPPALQFKTEMGSSILSLHSHFLHWGRKCFSFFPISPFFYPIILNFFPN